MRIVIVGGGTGGHLYPGIAVAQELQRWDARARITFVGSKHGLEHGILEREGYAHYGITASGLVRRERRQQLLALLRLCQGWAESIRLLRRLQPHMVLGLGSYIAAPVILAAWLLGIPRVIHEQNVIPGLANRLLGRIVNRVAVSFAESAAHFPKGKVVFTGNPVRPAMWQVRNQTRVPHSRFHLLVFGGSQGAHALNVAVLEAFPHLEDVFKGLWVVHQTGQDDHEAVRTAYTEKSYPGIVHAYIQDMAAEYTAADLVICRAGATTVAELASTGKPAILVPFPYAANGHQDVNARTLAAAGAATIIRDHELTGELLAARIRHYLGHPQEVAEMAARSLASGKPDAAMRVAHLCLELCRI